MNNSHIEIALMYKALKDFQEGKKVFFKQTQIFGFAILILDNCIFSESHF